MNSTYDDQTEFNGKLKPEVKTEWLTRLRSGNVEQTTGALRRLLTAPDFEQEFGYCCLGVLSDMYVERNAHDPLIKWVDPEESDPLHKNSTYTLQTDNGDSTGMPTSDVNLWAFSTGQSNGWYVYIDEDDAQKYERYLTGDNANTIYLPQMNDAGGSFADIADIIEKYL